MWSPVSLFALLALVGPLRAVSRDEFYPNGRGLDAQLPADDEVSSEELQLRVPIVLYGQSYSTIYVNTNGILSFRTDIPNFLNVEFPLDYPVIAPFYSNVDTRGSGTVFYRETQDAYVIAKARENVQQNYPQYSFFEPTSVFIATWADVGYHSMGSDKTNSYQAVIISDGSDSFVEFYYPDNGIQWIQGITQVAGLPDARGQAGFVSDDGRFKVLKGSGTDLIRMIESWSNTGNPGHFIFRVGNVVDNVEEPIGEEPNDNKNAPRSCSQGGSHQCHMKAQCIDRHNGFCCVCLSGYYGNGKTCLKSDVPLRVNGRIAGEINGHALEPIDLQSYVVMSDGRSYTALSKVPDELGYEMQSLNILGAVVGWLFAKPLRDAKNGYQITGGVLNHTTELEFPQTRDKITIKQHFTGLDVFDQLRMDVEIKGTIPAIPHGVKLELPDFEEQYSSSQPGLIISKSSRAFRNKDSRAEYPFEIQQFITYDVCPHSLPEDKIINPYTLKVAKYFIGFENREQIIRYGMSSKIAPLGQEDPCIAGRETCGPQSSCVVENDDFKCICNPGYQQIYPQDSRDSRAICVDINECSTGTHSCDINARCLNKEGSFDCNCNEGFEGNGETCKKISACKRHRCDPNAECTDTWGVATCRCNVGFKGDGNRCWPEREEQEEQDKCNNKCSPYATCISEPADGQRNYICHCLPGYSGDGYYCDPDYLENTSPYYEEDIIDATCILSECFCPSGYIQQGKLCYLEISSESPPPEKEEDQKQELAYPLPQCFDPNRCACPWTFNYDRRLHKCIADPSVPHNTKGPSGSTLSCNVVNRCHPYAQCVLISHTGLYECQCTAGYEGNGIECTEVEVSCVDVDICDVHASCTYDPGSSKSICVCNTGYQGDGNVCQSIADCETSEDCEENAECKYSEDAQILTKKCVCLPGYAKDHNDACVPLGGDCNMATCSEHATCQWDPVYQVKYCQCDSGYQGNGIDECQLQSTGCNVLNDCGLNANCLQDEISNIYKCTCNEGYYGDGYECSAELTCRYNPTMCSSFATCMERSGYYVCECNPGYYGNGQKCEKASKHEGNFLLINQGMATMRVPLNPTKTDMTRPIQISYYQMAIGLDIDCPMGRVYWSDITGKTIKSSKYDGTGIETFISDDIISPEGLSTDWIGRNIFWTDSRKDTIEVANIDTKVRTVLVDTGLKDPRGIAAHPFMGKIFWSDWNRDNPKIEWAYMNGDDRRTFLSGDSVFLPNSLSIDFQSNELCYADAGTKSIECVHITTMKKQTIATNCSYPFGLAITDTHYYWTDWITQKIESLDKKTRSIRKSIDLLSHTGNKLFGMVAVPNDCLGGDNTNNYCKYNNGDCKEGQLCLPNRSSRECITGIKTV